MNAKNLGIISGLLGHGVAIDQWDALQGFAKEASANEEAWGRPVLRLACRILQASGMDKSASFFHLKLLNGQPWSEHSSDVLHQVVDAIQATAETRKQAAALTDMANLGGKWLGPGTAGIGLAGKSLLYGSLGAGAGLGSLWWLLNRHSREDDAENESKQQQVDYYNRLASELDESLRRNNQYDVRR